MNVQTVPEIYYILIYLGLTRILKVAALKLETDLGSLTWSQSHHRHVFSSYNLLLSSLSVVIRLFSSQVICLSPSLNHFY